MKKVISFVLALIMLIGMLPMVATKAEAIKYANSSKEPSAYQTAVGSYEELSSRLDALMNKYNNKPWTSTDKACAGHGTNNTCYSKYYYGRQCSGFAKYIFNELFKTGSIGSTASGDYALKNVNKAVLIGQRIGIGSQDGTSVKELLSQAKPGDFIQMHRRNGNPHSMIVASVSDTGIKIFDNNSGTSRCTVRVYEQDWDTFASKNDSFSLYRSTNYPEEHVTNMPTGQVDNVFPGMQSVTITGWAYDRDDLGRQLTIHAYIGEQFIGGGIANVHRPDINSHPAHQGVGEYHGFEFTCRIPSGYTGTQTITVFAIDEESINHPILGSNVSMTVNIPADTEAPVISDVQYHDITSEGYTVWCRVKDNGGISSVKFPTWTEPKQDDVIWGEGTCIGTDENGSIYIARINISDHNYERSNYATHIYAYDYSGNVTSIGLLGDARVDVLPENAADIGTGFTALIFNKASWLPIENKYEITGDPLVRISEEDSGAYQLWYFSRQTDRSYIISSCYDGRNLDVLDASTEWGAKVQTHYDNGNDAQRWYLYEYHGGYVLQSKLSPIVLELPGNDTTKGTAVQMYSCNGTDAQIWSVFKGNECKLGTPELSATVNDKTVQFDWARVYGAKEYSIHIWKDSIDSENEYETISNTSPGHIMELPEGTYQAYVEAAHIYDKKTSDAVTFTVAGHTHSYSGTETLPTCLEQGYTTYVCDGCGDKYIDDYVDAVGHKFGDWINTVKVTCTANGEERRDCEYCDYFETRTVEATGHNYETVVTEPTCIAQGYTTHSCTECGDTYKDSYVDALGHGYGDWETTKEATCKENGQEQRICGNCKEIESRSLEATGHDYEEIVTAPTCMDKGFTTHTCSNCGDSYVDSYTDALGHDYGDWETVKEATYEKDGEERRECSRCGDEQKRIIPILTHSYESVVTAPTCTEKGYTTHTCTDCGDSYKDTYVEVLGHSFKDYVSDNNATCTADGTKTAKCERCDTTDTITDVGTAKGHAFGNWAVEKAATCVDKGTERRDCENCDHFESRVIEATGHNYEAVVTDPACTEKGYTTHTCSVCKDSYTDSETPALGHDYEYSIPVWPTTAVAGKLKDVCKNCQDTVTVTLPQLNEVDYTYKVMKEPTYTAEGTAMYTWKNTEYGNISFSIQLNRLVATLSEIKVASNPNKMAYEIGEELDTTGLILTAVYTDGSEKSITTGFTVSGFDSETAGEKTVTVTYEGETATFTVKVEAPIVSSAKYVIADAEATAGSLVEVYVEIANNPGIVSLRNKISYDSTALELVEVEDTGMLVGYTTPAATIQSPYILRWADSLATKNNEANGKIVKLTFRIKEDAKEGQYEISVEHVESRNVDGKKITFAKATAKINVIDYVVGDIDGDGEVSDWDAILLNRYLAGWDVQIILKAADIDGDGEVSDWDAIVLERYLAGWDVTLG